MNRVEWKLRNLGLLAWIASCLKPRERIVFDPAKTYELHGGNYVDETSIEVLPFMLIKPSGLSKEPEIKQLLRQYKVEIARELSIDDYRSLASQLFPNVSAVEREYWFQILESKYPASIHNRAKLLILSGIDISRLGETKRRIRKKVGMDFYRILIGRRWQETILTPIHCANPESLRQELITCLRYVTGGTPAGSCEEVPTRAAPVCTEGPTEERRSEE